MRQPEGYPALSPYLICPKADEVIAFAEAVLGAKLIRRFSAPDGGVMHAEVRLEDSVFMIGDAGEQWTAVPTNLHVYVDDVDRSYAAALAAGGTSVQEPMAKGAGDRRCGVRDVRGNTWWLATPAKPAG